MKLFDFFSQANAEYIDQLYQQYQKDPASLDERWQGFFEGFEAGTGPSSILESMLSSRSGSPAEGVNHLVHSYREFGHLIANLNPLRPAPESHPMLQLSNFGFAEPHDYDRQVNNGGFLGSYDGTLKGLLESLRATYCGTLGVEYTDIADKTQREWLQQKMEPSLNRPGLSTESRKRILELLVASEGFEQFLHTKYVGQKRFSIQGAESLIPLLDTLVEDGGALGADDFMMGMAHRGRLNVLANTLRKPYELILSEFEGTAVLPDDEGDGDVKYHLGYSSERETHGKKVGTTLSPNPSHLELVNPVVEGMVKARQDYVHDRDGSRVVPILIHGEAAFTGQGIVHETLSLSELPDYRTGGTVHVIVNNQVGFTAPPKETRFTPYPTDVAKMIQAPVFHVNAEDPEAVVFAAKLAIEFRQQFKVDVLIDLVCYRKFGHNETDDPTFTQPLMYKIIEGKTSIRDLYAQRLISEGVIDEAEFEQMKESLKQQLETALASAREARPRERISPFRGRWEGFARARDNWTADTALSLEKIREVGTIGTSVPDTFNIHPKIKKLYALRQEMAAGDRPVDWGCAEMWAFGSLLTEGTSIRLTGQDSERGTFTHRHATLHDYENGEKFTPLSNAAVEDNWLVIKNTMLSELAVLGFEYGYSTYDPKVLVLWEAQFGDFVNGAQAILDQFLSSAESKWDRMSGLVLLLPHGYEGQGPEHSSARLERFLQLCAENNLQVCYPSLPSQYFHVLRRQIHRKFRKPLVMMMPKSMLRDERSTSRISEFTGGSFQVALDDPAVEDAENVERILFCSGKVYFTLSSARAEKGTDEVAILRVEQLYPFPERELKEILARYPNAREFFWVQEEPKNMGAWTFAEPRLRKLLPEGAHLEYRGRSEAASPAHGYYRVHQLEEQEFVKASLEMHKSASRSDSKKSEPKLKEQHGNQG